MTWVPYDKWVCLLTYYLNPDSAQTSGITGRCHSSESWVCKCLKLMENKNRQKKWSNNLNTLRGLFWLVSLALFQKVFMKNYAQLVFTCRQDELTIPRHFDRGAHCGHLKVLDELNPALDVWGKIMNQKVIIMTSISKTIKQSVMLKLQRSTHQHLSFVTVSSFGLTATALKTERWLEFCMLINNIN